MRVLIIEDEYNLADVISDSLKKEKYQVDIRIDSEEKIFERFYRVDKSRNIDHNHYGTIKAFSSNGKTTFQVTFEK